MPQSYGEIYRWLGRNRLDIKVPEFDNKRILVTGAEGYIGNQVCNLLGFRGGNVWRCDIDNGNILSPRELKGIFYQAHPDIVIHLAAHKYATRAEEEPAKVAELNIIGTNNVTELAAHYNAKLILASTCKAADPCTAYGASKLIAEKVVLNYWNGVAFRLVNVIGSTGSVVDIWNKLPEEEPLPIVSAYRYWISAEEAVSFLLASTALPRGLYGPNTHYIAFEEPMHIARRYDPNRQVKLIPLRKGDRWTERVVGEYERAHRSLGSFISRIEEPWTRV